MTKKILAILEGPLSEKVAGMRHIALVSKPGYPIMCLSYDGGRSAAYAIGARHYPVGTWEIYPHAIGFPLPRPEILSEIFGTKQAELPV